MEKYLSVTELTSYLKLKFMRDPYLEKVYLTGEVSNFRSRSQNSHQYFVLKDEKAMINAVIWAQTYAKFNFQIEEGMKLNVVGRINLYDKQGSYNISIERAEPDGVGALAVRFEQLKKKLLAEGLFNANHKKAIPRYPKKIGVITSQDGAVIRDIITTVSRRFPGVEILLFPTKVQGDGAAEAVARNIVRANQRTDLDLLIVGRGGGSIEDLWAFNEEVVVRAIYDSQLPVISSVGHETDTTLADYVADKRAATPTAAAELATAVTKAELFNAFATVESRMYTAVNKKILLDKARLEKVGQSVLFRQPERLYDGYLQKLDSLETELVHHMQRRFEQEKQAVLLLDQQLKSGELQHKIQHLASNRDNLAERLGQAMERLLVSKVNEVDKYTEQLMSLDTSRIVARGYAIISKGDHVIQSTTELEPGDRLSLEMKDGQVEVEVKDVNRKNI